MLIQSGLLRPLVGAACHVGAVSAWSLSIFRYVIRVIGVSCLYATVYRRTPVNLRSVRCGNAPVKSRRLSHRPTSYNKSTTPVAKPTSADWPFHCVFATRINYSWDWSPAMWELKFLMEWCSQNFTETKGKWVPARPVQFYNFFVRLYHAWNVLIGKADSFIWPEGQ